MITRNPDTSSLLNWFVLYTKSRSEKKVADGLRQKGLEVYCPMRMTKRKWSDRYKWVEEPLFRSYCFVRLADKDRSEVFGVPGVVRYLFWLGKPAVIRNEEIESLREMLGSFDHHQIALREFDVHDRVKVKGGAFDTHEGEIVEKRGSKLRVLMEVLRVMVYVDLKSVNVEKV